MDLDEWALRRGRDVLKDCDRLRDLGLDENAIADFQACAFEPEPRLHGDCVDPQRQEFIEQLLETPDYQALHATTMLQEAASAIATVSFAEQFAALRKETTESKDALDREMETLACGRSMQSRKPRRRWAKPVKRSLPWGWVLARQEAMTP